MSDPDRSPFLREAAEALQIAGVVLSGNWFDALLSEALSSARFALRKLSAEERRTLELRGNSALDWDRILVGVRFDPEQVIGNRFAGPCVLGAPGGESIGDAAPSPDAGSAGTQRDDVAHRTAGPVPLPEGIYHSTLCDSIVEDGAAVHRCPWIGRYRIRAGAAVSASTLVFEGPSACGIDGSAAVGVETGGREVPLLPELNLADAVLLAEPPGPVDTLRAGEAKRLADAARAYAARFSPELGVVAEGASVHACALVSNSWIGAAARIAGTPLLEESVLLSSAEERTRVESGAVVHRSVLQQGVTVRDGAIIDGSLLLEHSHVERHGKVSASVLGPNSGIGEGELTASLVGPFVGFHHQALLIAALWPEGRGNIAYGANVGSNHTSRQPDQEVWPGEGMFFGLGCNVKFPANFRASPYSLVATGVTTLPQRLSMPFSLISDPAGRLPGAPAGFLQLVPGWMLRENLYALWRNQLKFRDRDRARRNPMTADIFRPEIMRMVETACAALERAPDREITLPADVPEIGKNVVTDADRRAAVEIYRFFLEWARLRDVLHNGTTGDRELSREEHSWYAKAVDRIAAMVRSSREKDFLRGGRLSEDYERVHGRVEDDPVVADALRYAQQERALLLQAPGVLD